MIKSFADGDTESLFKNERVKRLQAIERQARRKLLLLDSARELADLRVPPGNRLEALAGDRVGQHSDPHQRPVRGSASDGLSSDAHDVEIVDYH